MTDTTKATFYKTFSTGPVVNYVANQIQKHLDAGQKVFWLVPGGSAASVAAEVAKKLSGDLAGLSVTLTDERYGKINHKGSNWLQLQQTGFTLKGANLLPVLRDESMEETRINYENILKGGLDSSDYVIGLFGMGADGHTAGVLPGSTAVGSKKLAEAYEAPPYQRITMTLVAIARLNEAIVYAMGSDKHKALENLDKDLSEAIQPAQALKKVGKLSIYNDYKGEEA